MNKAEAATKISGILFQDTFGSAPEIPFVSRLLARFEVSTTGRRAPSMNKHPVQQSNVFDKIFDQIGTVQLFDPPLQCTTVFVLSTQGDSVSTRAYQRRVSERGYRLGSIGEPCIPGVFVQTYA